MNTRKSYDWIFFGEQCFPSAAEVGDGFSVPGPTIKWAINHKELGNSGLGVKLRTLDL